MIERLRTDCDLSDEQVAAIRRYSDLLRAWNAHTNLTAITEPDAIAIRHFYDSLTCLRALPEGAARLIDVGTGAGVPGLPLRIARPALALTLVDSVNKKVAFVRHVAEELGLAGVTALHARAEALGQQPDHREAYDAVLARSVAHLPVLAEYLLPLCRVGGLCIAMKGESAAREVDEAADALALLGGEAAPPQAVNLPGEVDPHYLVVIEKIAPTPPDYPRRPGRPRKRPL
ncbi:MAG: 16S rRNA (guanine(527)-N(7))-methyltransferase RsmG [Anaerolineae bacterium]